MDINSGLSSIRSMAVSYYNRFASSGPTAQDSEYPLDPGAEEKIDTAISEIEERFPQQRSANIEKAVNRAYDWLYAREAPKARKGIGRKALDVLSSLDPISARQANASPGLIPLALLIAIALIFLGCPSSEISDDDRAGDDDDTTISDDDTTVADDDDTTVGDDDDTTACTDEDGDGYCVEEDCDDSNASVYSGAPELCDGLDNNCNGVVPADEADSDADGYLACEECDDNDATVYPGAEEIAWDGIDQDCDGQDLECPYYVDVNNVSGIEDGSEANPYTTIQGAIDNIDTSQCSEILAFPGTYYENNITLEKSLTLHSTQGAEVTIIDGSLGQHGVIINQTGGTGVTFEGFSVVNCTEGTAIAIGDCAAGETCIIQHNITRNNGIGIATGEDGITVTIRNNLIVGNSRGIHCPTDGDISDISIENNVIVGNDLPGLYGERGIFLDHGATPLIQNNIIAYQSYGVVGYYDYSDPQLQYNCFYENSIGHYTGGAVPGPGDVGNLIADPLFVAFSDDGDWTNDDFHLQVSSPCVDAGNPDAAYDDVDGTLNDMGAYGGPLGSW